MKLLADVFPKGSDEVSTSIGNNTEGKPVVLKDVHEASGSFDRGSPVGWIEVAPLSKTIHNDQNISIFPAVQARGGKVLDEIHGYI
jgi:hypothetical protein